MKIILAGGGTLGSVSPLIAIYEAGRLRRPDWQWLWVGTKNGPEKEVAAGNNIPYIWIPEAKLRRYVSVWTVFEPLFFVAAWIKSLFILAKEKPDVIIGAGSFVSVPVAWAAWFFQTRVFLHQQDIVPSLSNVLAQGCAEKITVSFAKSLQDFPDDKRLWTGNPIRSEAKSANAAPARKEFGLDPEYPTILITGGSSGAQALNRWAHSALLELVQKANVVHLTGKGKDEEDFTHSRYHKLPFVGGVMFFHLLAAADITVARAGISTITELSYLARPAIFIPMTDTHQEENAAHLASAGAALTLSEAEMEDKLLDAITKLLDNPEEAKEMGERMGALMKKGAEEKILDIIEKFAL